MYGTVYTSQGLAHHYLYEGFDWLTGSQAGKDVTSYCF